MLDDERKMKTDAENDMKRFFKNDKASKSMPYSSNTSFTSKPSELHYSSAYKSIRPKTTEQFFKLIKSGQIKEVTKGTYHFSITDKSGYKKYFKFIVLID